MPSEPPRPAVVIDWKQLAVYLALGVGLFLVAYEVVERLARWVEIENSDRGRRTLFGAAALIITLPVFRLLVRWLDFMPKPPLR